MNENGVLMEWYWQGKTGIIAENPVQDPVCPILVTHGMAWDRTQPSAGKGEWLSIWAILWPVRIHCSVPCQESFYNSLCVFCIHRYCFRRWRRWRCWCNNYCVFFSAGWKLCVWKQRYHWWGSCGLCCVSLVPVVSLQCLLWTRIQNQD